MTTLVTTILEACHQGDKYDPNRTRYSVLAHATSELGELAQEVAIVEGHSYKQPSSDGVVGEGVDTILAVLDLIYRHNPDITEEDLIEIARAKGGKWISSLKKHNGIQDETSGPAEDGVLILQSGLGIKDMVTGSGPVARSGQNVTVHYTGWLQNADGSKGRKFDSSKDRNDPFAFTLGAGFVIRGWDEGVQGMAVGGQRQLIIPSALGYGSRGAGGVIPPDATLIFDVELLSV
jgi:FKBP-type peptidyl-prolyl cis-trans isomerase FkpA